MAYPVDLELDAPREVANWRPFVQWLLAFPHALIISVLDQVAGVMAFVSWVIIVFTGKMPDGIARFQCMVLRYETRVAAYGMFLHESYPPFEFEMVAADTGTDPLRVSFVPQLEDRDRVTCFFRLLWVIPSLFYAFIILFAAWFMLVAGFFSVLFTGKWPDGPRDFVVKSNRLLLRINAYARLLVDDYPPFTLDDASIDLPPPPPPAPAAPAAPPPPPPAPAAPPPPLAGP